MAQVTLIGLDSVGNALGLALRRYALLPENRAQRFTVVGYDPNHDRAQQAQRKHQSIDRAVWSLPDAVREAAFVVITLPVRQIRQVLIDIAPHLPQGAIVSDTASTKGIVLRWAAEILPPGVSFVGGHPLPKRLPSAPDSLGAELEDVVTADMFRGGIYCVMPLPNASEAAVNQVISLATLLGAQPYFVDPLEHDSFMAAVMHLPTLLGAALMHHTTASPVWRELGPLAGAGFRDVTTLAGSDPEQMRDALLANREPLLHWLDRYLIELSDLREALLHATDGDPATVAAAEERLGSTLSQAATARSDWLRGVSNVTGMEADVSRSLNDASNSRISQNLVGGWLAGRFGNQGSDDDKKDRRGK